MRTYTISPLILLVAFTIVPTLFFPLACFAEPAESPVSAAPKTFKEVLEVVIQSNTKIRSFVSKSEGLKGLVTQASLLPNPEIEVELENFSGDLSGTDESEFTTSIGQKIETAGKRTARTDLAKAKRESFLLEAKTEVAEIIGNVKTAYQQVLFAQARKALAEQELHLAKDVYSAVEKKVRYGGVLRVELTKAEMALQSAQIKLANARQILDESKNELSSYWGGDGFDIGKLPRLPLSESNDTPLTPFDVKQSPFYKLSESRLYTATARHRNERALIYPDVTARVGYRRIEETGDNTFITSLSVPIPLFNRNQGSVRNASKLQEATKQEHINNTRRLHSKISNLQKRLEVQTKELKLLKSAILPQSKKALDQVKSAYALGKVSYLDLLDSQSRYIEARERELIVSKLTYQSKIELQKLKGTVLHGLGVEIFRRDRNE